MRVLDVGVDSLGTEALKDAVEKAKDEKFSPILLSVNGDRMESGCSWGVDCVEGSICRILVCMCGMFLIIAHHALVVLCYRH